MALHSERTLLIHGIHILAGRIPLWRSVFDFVGNTGLRVYRKLADEFPGQLSKCLRGPVGGLGQRDGSEIGSLAAMLV